MAAWGCDLTRSTASGFEARSLRVSICAEAAWKPCGFSESCSMSSSGLILASFAFSSGLPSSGGGSARDFSASIAATSGG
eukprot:2942647-Lingulodinium_polyedra.AAC.1